MTTDNSTLNAVKPLSANLKSIFDPDPIPVDSLTPRERFLAILQVLRTYGTELRNLCTPFAEYLRESSEKLCSYAAPSDFDENTQCFSLCTISTKIYSTTLLLVTPEEQFFHCKTIYATKQIPKVTVQRTPKYCDVYNMTNSAVQGLLTRQPQLCAHSIGNLHLASRTKINQCRELADTLSLTNQEIVKFVSRISF